METPKTRTPKPLTILITVHPRRQSKSERINGISKHPSFFLSIARMVIYCLMEEMMYIQILICGMKGSHGKSCMDEKIHRINMRKQKYKRSTNNSHKKFICVARKLLFKLCTYADRELFEKEFQPYQNSRVYYFVILAHVKIRMNESQRGNFKRNLATLLQAKMEAYHEQIRRANNKNFINFRFEEIADIEFALRALSLYLEDRVEEAIEVIYKKEKGFVLKKQQFEMAIQIVKDLEERLRSFPEGELFPYLDEKPRGGEVVKEKAASGRGKREDDEEWVEEMWQQQHGKHIMRRQKRKEAVYNRGAIDTKNPLLFLEHSYSITPHFYSVLFNYQEPTFPNQTAAYPYGCYNFNSAMSMARADQSSSKKETLKTDGTISSARQGEMVKSEGVNVAYLHEVKGEEKFGVLPTAADAANSVSFS